MGNRRGLTWARRAGLAAAAGGLFWLLTWTAARALIVSAPLDRADAILILAGPRAAIERSRHAARLYRDGVAPIVILTDDGQQAGWSSREERNPLFIERSIAELRGQAVPAAAIQVLPDRVSSTHDEAIVLLRFATRHRLRSILLVTSAYHSRRALWVFRRVLSGSRIEVGIDPVEPGQQTPWPGLWWLSPAGWRDVAEEYVKLGIYLVRFR